MKQAELTLEGYPLVQEDPIEFSPDGLEWWKGRIKWCSDTPFVYVFDGAAWDLLILYESVLHLDPRRIRH